MRGKRRERGGGDWKTETRRKMRERGGGGLGLGNREGEDYSVLPLF